MLLLLSGLLDYWFRLFGGNFLGFYFNSRFSRFNRLSFLSFRASVNDGLKGNVPELGDIHALSNKTVLGVLVLEHTSVVVVTNGLARANGRVALNINT